MSFIEGIGDEVTLFLVIVIVFILAALVTLIGSESSYRNASASQPDVVLEQDTQTLPQGTEIYSATIEIRNDPTLQAIEDFVEGLDDHSDDGNTNNSPEEQALNQDLTTSGDARTGEDATGDASTVSDTNDSLDTTGDARTVEDSEQQNPSAPPLEEHVANGITEIPQPLPGEIRIRLKYLNDTERTVLSNPNTKIGDFKNKHFSDDIRNNKVVRLIFAGRLLNNNFTLQQCRVLDNSVVHVQILQVPLGQGAPAASQEAELDLGRLLWPALTAILGLCWMTYIKYPEVYNMMSLGILLLFTGSFFFFLSQAQH